MYLNVNKPTGHRRRSRWCKWCKCTTWILGGGAKCMFCTTWISVLEEALEAISSNTSDKKIQAIVSGFLRRLTDFDFYFCLLLSHSLFEKTDILSKQLQNTRVGKCKDPCSFSKKR